jgi:hyperosmotically inducible periplasmic protein
MGGNIEMRVFGSFVSLLLAFIVFAAVEAGAQDLPVDQSTTLIGQQVHKKILRLPYYEVFDHIGFSVDGDTVTLFGQVRNGVNKSDAEGNVKRIPGVSKVINNIEILPPSRFDDVVRRNLYASLSNTGGLSRYLWPVNPPVRLLVRNGHITLEGTVRHRGDYDAMNIIASGIPGTFSVTNNLKVSSDVPR